MRLYYIDALKGIGALVVFFSHINVMLGVVDLPQYLKFFINGEFAVTMFLILSGFSISLSLNKNKPVSNFIIGRFFRFALPMAIAGTFAYTLYLLGLYRNHFVTESLGNWFAKNEYSDISIGSYIASLLWSPVGCTSLNNPLWMMKYIFWGSYIILILHLATSR